MESTHIPEVHDLLYSAALRDFQEARRRAAMQDLKSALTGKSTDLLSYEEIRQLLKAEVGERQGLQEIPLDAIVGSVGRYSDFTRSFQPRRSSDRHRWAKIKLKAVYQGGLPPIEVYKIGDAYFVLDGNHRVSVLRQLGATTVQAYVTEVYSRVPLSPDAQPDDLIIAARYADFLERTALDRSRPGIDLTVTSPGQYRVLDGHIELHRQLLSLKSGREVGVQEAAASWCDEVYEPVVQAIRDLDILDDFPNRTETDLYVWVAQRQEELARELGWEVRPAKVAADLAARRSRRLQHVAARLGEQLHATVMPELLDGPHPGEWRNVHLAEHLQEQLFPDILVPVNGAERGWLALDQALIVAQREGSELHGFHVVRSKADRNGAAASAIQEEFDLRCRRAGVPGKLVVEVGPVATSICDRARWTDLVVTNLAYPPGRGLIRRVSSGFRTLVRLCSRPILAVPQVSPLTSALVAYDGSPKAREALYIATYLAGAWPTALTVLTVAENHRTNADTLAGAQSYLEQHGVEGVFVEESGPVADAILRTAARMENDLIIAGGYGFRPVLEVVLGSTVDQLLRESRQPLLICR